LFSNVTLLAGGCFGDIAAARTSSAAGTTTTIIIVRHAERDPGLDPPLVAEGERRAEALKEALLENGVTAIYTTDLLRNRQSVQPLADALGLEVNLVSPLLYANMLATAASLVDEFLTDHAGGTILFCGNTSQAVVVQASGINAEIYARLGGTGRAPERYQDMYIAVVPDEGPTRFIKTEYGGHSSRD
jgi:broad specificity phosphatase PhoE